MVTKYRDEAAQKLSLSSGQTRAGVTEVDAALFDRNRSHSHGEESGPSYSIT